MKDEDLQFDRTWHVLYSKPCKKQIRAKIALLHRKRSATHGMTMKCPLHPTRKISPFITNLLPAHCGICEAA